MSELAPSVTGLAIPIRLPGSLARVRRRWDRAALDGAGAHVTILYPFLATDRLTPAVRAVLAQVAATEPPFDAAFHEVRHFDGELVWVEPADPGPFQRLTDEVVRHWPDHPPYEGVFDRPIVHLTVVESRTAPLAEIEAAARAALPFTGRAERVELWRQDQAGRWRPQWRLRLGGGVRR